MRLQGYNDAGRARTDKRGRPKRLFERNGQFFVWQRPKGRWRPRVFYPGRRPQWSPDWVSGRRGRFKLMRVWRVRCCDQCGNIKNTWQQTVMRIAVRQAGGGWRVRSFPLRPDQVRRPEYVGQDDKKPLLGCLCNDNNGIPRRIVVDDLAKHLLRKQQGSTSDLLTVGSAAVW